MNTEQAQKLIHALRKLAKNDLRLNVNELRIIVALERAVARLQYDRTLAKHLIFKGGFVLLKHYESSRFTRDADALAIDISQEKLKGMVCQALAQDLDDGLWYGDIQTKLLEEQGKYGALRFELAFQVGKPKPNKIHKLSRIHIDIGFSDQLIAQAKDATMMPLFDMSVPISWKIYSIEQIVAEKLETLFQRNIENSRSKDVYDLTYLIPRCKDKELLLSSINQTFKIRDTPLPTSFCETALTFGDLSVLEVAWPGVKTLEPKPAFSEIWKTLLKCLQQLDEK